MRSHSFNVVAGLLASLAGCSKSADTTGHGNTKQVDSAPRHQFAGMEFAPPTAWTIERIHGGLLLMAPEVEAGSQANLFLELMVDTETRSLQEALADLAPNLAARKQQFRETRRFVENHSNGFRLGRIEYSCFHQGTALTEWETVIEFGGNKRLFVLASSASASWARYQPIFEAFFDSLRKNGD